MKKTFLRLAAVGLALMFAICNTGCAAQPNTSSAAPTADPKAYSILYTAEPTAEPAADSETSAESSEETTPEPSAEPSPESVPVSEETAAEIAIMYPLLEAHVLAQLNGGVFNSEDPEYFWQVTTFAIDGCGLDFYSAETFGSALTLSRGVIEEIVSALFEGGGSVLLEIPESLHGEIRYDAEADAFSHPLGESVFSVKPEALTQNEDGSVTFDGSLYYAEDETPVTRFTAVLVSNTRDGNSLFTYSVRSLQLCE